MFYLSSWVKGVDNMTGQILLFISLSYLSLSESWITADYIHTHPIIQKFGVSRIWARTHWIDRK